MSDSTPPATAPTTPPKKNSKLILFIVAGLVFAGGAGGGAFWWTHRGTAEAAEGGEAKPKKHAERGIVSFEPFVVNLADTNASRFLRASVQVVVSEPEVAARIKEKPVELM